MYGYYDGIPSWNSFGETLRKLRKEKRRFKYTTKIANKLGVSTQRIYSYEKKQNSRKIPLDFFLGMCRAYGIQECELCDLLQITPQTVEKELTSSDKKDIAREVTGLSQETLDRIICFASSHPDKIPQLEKCIRASIDISK